MSHGPDGVTRAGPSRDDLADLAPLLRRAVGLQSDAVLRLRITGDVAAALVRLPFAVLVGRSLRLAAEVGPDDVTWRAADALGWLDGDAGRPPERDGDWRWAVPPGAGWTAVERVPDTVVRPLVRSGALTLKQAAEREGVPGASPRAEVADHLLDSVVLTATGAGGTGEVTLRTLSALIRMGFLPRGGTARVDVAGRWVRVVAEYGTVYAERPGTGLHLL